MYIEAVMQLPRGISCILLLNIAFKWALDLLQIRADIVDLYIPKYNW